ncbi:MAG: hypothetical protein IJ097_03820 [Bacilli bacterium]|nr:hypothetical protein [Bacilli bacterium]
MNNDMIINEVNEYINNNLTVKETAEKLGISKRTFQLHLKKVKDLDLKLHNLVLKKQQKNIRNGRILGGKKGKVKPRYSMEEAVNMAYEIIKNELTYEEASLKFDIPKSTIYEMVHSSYISPEMKAMLELVAISNTKGVMVSDIVERKGYNL